MADKNLIKILFIEDLSSDVDLAVLELRKEKIKFEYTTVCTRVDLLNALKEFKPDVIISDYQMPSFNGLHALKDSKEYNPEIPFILCTGSVNEETAVRCIKEGAEDYVIKEHITRLPFAVKEALAQVMVRKEKRASDLLLKESEEKLQSIFSAAPVGIGLVVNRMIFEINDAFCNITGFSRSDLIGKSSEILYPSKEDYEFVGQEKYRQISEKGLGTVETRFKCKDGRVINIILSSSPLDTTDLSKGVTFTILDITARKNAENATKESYRQINTLIGNLIGLVYRCRNDQNWTMEFLSEGIRELTGYLPEEIINNARLSFNDIIHKDDRDYVWKEVQKALAIHKHFQCTYRIVKQTGEIRWVWEKGEGVFSDNNEFEFIEGFITDITERKQIEEELKNSETKFRSIAENLSDVIFITDSSGIINYVSPAIKSFGYLPEDCNGKFFGDYVPEVELENAMSIFYNALNSVNIESSVSLHFKRKDNSVFYAELTGSHFRFGDGSNGVLGLLRDVSGKMKSENELRKLSRAVEQSPTSIVITDIDGRIEYVNPKFCEITGYSDDELMGKTPGILSSGETSREEYDILWDTIKSGNDWKGEFHNKKKNGELYWESASISPVKNDKDEITHFLGIKEDISKRKRSEQVQKALFVISNAVITTNDLEKLIEIIQEQIGTIIDTKNFFVAFYDEDSDMLSSPFVQDEMDKISSWPANKSLTGYVIKNNKSILLKKEDILEMNRLGVIDLIGTTAESWLGVPLSIGGKVNGAYVVQNYENADAYDMQDLDMLKFIANQISQSIYRQKAIVELKKALIKAEAGDKLKTTFLNNISHEVRTPLNGILGFAEIVSQPGLSEEEKKELLSMLYESSDRLLNTITSYMDISLVTSGNMSAIKKDFKPSKILQIIYDNFKSNSSAKGLNLLLEIPERINSISVNSDPEILQKIVSHLIINAIKFTNVGSIWFGYEIQHGVMEFFVKDTGIGIGKESIDKIFERFVKEDLGPSNISEGSGLGLSIAKGMIDLLGGSIRVESEIDIGSSFYFTIPLSTVSEIDEPGAYERVINHVSNRSSILIAEDDETNFFFLKALLMRETKSTILHASNGKEAVDMFKTNSSIVLILMDIKMPGIDGLEATRQIKQLNQNIPVIAITAYAMSGDEERVLAAGCDGYLSKPITKNSLLNKISEFVKI